MSLINKMLADLDARGVSPGATLTADNICHDLRPVIAADAATSRTPHWMSAALIATVILGGAAVWSEWAPRFTHDSPEPMPRDVTTTLAPPVPNLLPTVAVVAPFVTTTTEERLPVSESPESVLSTEPHTVTQPSDAPLPSATPMAPHVEPVLADVFTPTVEQPVPAIVDKKVRVLTAEQQAENNYQMALVQYRSKQPDRAESSLRDVLSTHPTHLQARELLAGLLLEGGRAADATEVLVEGLAHTPSHYVFASMLSGIYIELGEESMALTTLESAQSHAQGDADYRGFLATLYQRANRHAEAIENYRAALSLRVFESKWWLGLGISYEAMRDSAAAENAFMRAQKDGRLTPALSRYADDRLRDIHARKTATQ